jgi:hypothetical protein
VDGTGRAEPALLDGGQPGQQVPAIGIAVAAPGRERLPRLVGVVGSRGSAFCAEGCRRGTRPTSSLRSAVGVHGTGREAVHGYHYRRLANLHIIPTLGEREVQRLTPNDLRALYRQLGEKLAPLRSGWSTR